MRHEASLPLQAIGQPAETFLTETQLAELLQVSKRSIQRWRVEGCGPRFRCHGSCIRYALSDVLSWSEEHSATSTSEVSSRRRAISLEGAAL